MRIAILDPAAGISGDMTLGALLSLGVPSAWLEGLPNRLGLAGVGVAVRDVVRCGVGCKQVEFMIPEQPHGRHVGELVRLVARAPVSEWVRERAGRAFQLVGEAEVASRRRMARCRSALPRLPSCWKAWSWRRAARWKGKRRRPREPRWCAC